MGYKTVLFDLDGTLLDTTEGVVNAVRRTIRDNGFLMPTESELKEFVGPPMQKTMSERFGLEKYESLKVANEFRANYKKYSLFQASLYDGILDLLKELKEAHYQVAVATNKSHQNAVDIIEKFGIRQYCDYVLGSDLEGKLDKRDIICLCIKHLGSKKSETVLVGDSVFDLEGAEQAGVDFIAVTYGFGFKKGDIVSSKRCVHTVDNVKKLADFFLNCN